MSILFKFMPLRDGFFEDPLVRLTPPYALNDPFDSKPSNFAINKKTDFFFEGKGKKKEIEYYTKSLIEKINSFGIISLTKDPKNILMWSHYANDHQGMVIGIECDEKTFSYHDEFSKYCETKSHRPLKVTYSLNRPSENIPDNAIYEYFEDNFNRLFMLTKSRCWKYEKEYRYLIRKSEADAAIAVCNDFNWIDSSNEKIKVSKISENSFKFEVVDGIDKSYLIWFLAGAEGSGKIKDVKLFKRINIDSIKYIIFGSRVAEDDLCKISNKLKSINRNIVLKKCIESNDKFEIEILDLIEK